MKKIAFVMLLLLFTVVGCSKEAPPPKDVSSPSVQNETTITIAGTGVAVLDKLVEAYQDANPEVKIEVVHGTKVKAAIKGVVEGKFHMVGLNRPLNQQEQSQKLKSYPFAIDGMCFVSYPHLKELNHLSKEDVRKIYSGEIKKWSDLGGPNEDIVLIDKMEGDSDNNLLRDKILGSDLVVREDIVLITKSSEMIKTLSKTPNSFGFVSNGLANVLDVKLKKFQFEGVAPNPDNIATGKYPFTVTYALVSVENPPQEVQRFIDFMYENEAKKVLLEYGYAAKRQ